MKKFLKIILIVTIVLFCIILLDSIQARIFRHSPIISWKEQLADSDSWVDRGLIIDTYYCTKEKDIVNVSWTYTESKYDDYQNKATLVFIHDGIKLSLVELK